MVFALASQRASVTPAPIRQINSGIRKSVSNVSGNLENTDCEICGSSERTQIVQRRDLFLGGETYYAMYRCRICGAVYQDPRPAQDCFYNFYPSEYPQFTKAVASENIIRRGFRYYGLLKRCAVVTNRIKQGRILDVGCATGDFLSVMKDQKGWKVVGLEPVHAAARFARIAVNSVIVESTVIHNPFPANQFDAITMWDVLEHLHQPVNVIEECSRLLKTGGLLIINHPNLTSLDRQVFGRYWMGYELPRHLNLFPDDLLRRITGRYGFVEVERRCLYGSHAATATSIGLWANEFLGVNGMTRSIKTLLFSGLLRLLLWPYFKAIDSMRLGSNVMVVFRKVS